MGSECDEDFLLDDSEINESPSQIPVKRKRKAATRIAAVWTDENIEELISHVEQHPPVWDYSSKEYKIRSVRLAGENFHRNVHFQQPSFNWLVCYS